MKLKQKPLLEKNFKKLPISKTKADSIKNDSLLIVCCLILIGVCFLFFILFIVLIYFIIHLIINIISKTKTITCPNCKTESKIFLKEWTYVCPGCLKLMILREGTDQNPKINP